MAEERPSQVQPAAKDPVFLLMVSGQIESAEFPEYDDLYCNYSFVSGQDWAVVSGLCEGITQSTRRSSGPNKHFVWNFPIDVTFKSTNPFGWPQIVVSVYGVNSLGRDEVRGYGCIHLPITPGQHKLKLPMFVPASESHVSKFIAWIFGRSPEFIDPKFISQGEGRELTKTKSQGHVTVSINVVTKDLWKQGFRSGANEPQPTITNSSKQSI